MISTSAGIVKVFEGQEEIASFNAHAGKVTGLALHPSGDIVASIGVDKSYVLYDMNTLAVATQVYSNTGMSLMYAMLAITKQYDQRLRVYNYILMVIFLLRDPRMDRLSCSMSRQELKQQLLGWTEQ